MTKSTITRERLEEIVSDPMINHGSEFAMMASMALAAMDSEPVAEVCEDYAIRYISSGPAPKEGLHPGDKLYRHAQQLVVLNGFSVNRMEMLADRITTRITSLEIHERAGNISSTQQETLDAFRIALEVLAVKQAQLPGSEPATVPGKWIPLSERMPEIGDIVITAMGEVVNVGEMECSAANCRFFTSVISGRELPATHWMPLPASPKDVKP